MRIILAEDSAIVREGFVRILMHHAHDVVEHADGLAAWQLLQAETGLVDVIISDYEMPHMNGLELLRRVRAHPRLKDKHFVLASGYLPTEVEREALERGSRVLKKPCSTPELLDTLYPYMERQSRR